MLKDTSFGSRTSSTTSPPMASYPLALVATSRPSNNSHAYRPSNVSPRQLSDRSFDSQPPPLTASSSDPSAFMVDPRSTVSILIRRMPRNTSSEAVNAMLLFSGDLVSVEIVTSPYAEDSGYTAARAQFRSTAGAYEAQARLHGKTQRDVIMQVEMQNTAHLERRATIDGLVPRQESGSTSSASSFGAPPPARSRFNSTFQSTDKSSPQFPAPESVSNGNGFGGAETNHIQNLFLPTSPLTMTNGFTHGNRVSGKSVINNDDAEDDEGQALMKDPAAFSKSGQQLRRSSHAQIPMSHHFSRMSLGTDTGTNGHPGTPSDYTAYPNNYIKQARRSQAYYPPRSPTNLTGMNTGNAFSFSKPRHQNPPSNPADQNPPCNTLYVGNLPVETCEDELKAMFSTANGYKRLCFRTKQNGPMCFVEFEDTSAAAHALDTYYGLYLQHSTVAKGGVRLSFSKNPLGVRSGQSNNMVPNGGYSHNPGMGAPGYTTNGQHASNGSNFAAASGPPPGIIRPPGFPDYNRAQQMLANPYAAGYEQYTADAFGSHVQYAQPPFLDQAGPRGVPMSGGVPENMLSKYGRDSRNGFSNMNHMNGR